MTLGLVCDACDALSPIEALQCARCGRPLVAAPAPPAASWRPPTAPHGTVTDEAALPVAPPPAVAAAPAPSPPGPGVRYCHHCGAAVPATFRFCGECGARLDAPAPSLASGKTLFFSPLQATGRARLVLIKGDGLDSISYHLAGTEHIVGRSDGEILFPDDPLVSPRHANFFYHGEALHVRDDGSDNGVFLRIKGPVRLAPGQPFLVGEQLLVVDLPAADVGLAVDAEGTCYYGSPRRPARMRLVQILAGGQVGMAIRLGGDVISIGREGNHVNFPEDPFISGHHAQLAPLDDGGFHLADVGSKNGTFVRVAGEAQLEHGDHVFVGQQLLRVEVG